MCFNKQIWLCDPYDRETEHFHHPNQCAPMESNLVINDLFSSVTLLLSEYHIHKINVAFCVWLLLLSIILFRLIYVAVYANSSFLFIAK